MKIKNPFSGWLTTTIWLLVAASQNIHAAPHATFTDSWKDSYSASQQGAVTAGSFSVSISLPNYGVDVSQVDANSQFSLSIGPAGNTTPIFSDTFGDSESYSGFTHSARFALLGMDAFGNEFTNGSLFVSWGDNTITVTGGCSSDALQEEPLFVNESSGSPVSYNLNSAVSGTNYEIFVQLDASDNGGGTYTYDNPDVPVTGSDRETDEGNTNGSFTLEKGSVSGAADVTPPKLAITGPRANSGFAGLNPTVDLQGTASDSAGLTNIQCFVNGDPNDPLPIDQIGDLPTNRISWTVEVDLSQYATVGPNILTVVAQDALGNEAAVSRTFSWIVTNTAYVKVNPPGSGTVKGIKNGQELVEGAGYVVTATPASDKWIFSQWTDTNGDPIEPISSNPTIYYYGDTNADAYLGYGGLVADFATNMFYHSDLAGTYTGLFYDTNSGVMLDDAGYITVTVTEKGGYSGKLYLAAPDKAVSMAGQLTQVPGYSLAQSTTLVKVTATDYLNVTVQIATDTNLTAPGAGLLGGSVSAYLGQDLTNYDTAQIQGALSFYNSNVLHGLYNVVIAPLSSDPSQGPGGYGFGGATVSPKGAVALTLNLPDGTTPTLSQSSFVQQNGSAPFFASLYGGKGMILGWLVFATDGSGAMQPQNIVWEKLPLADRYYTGSFANNTTLSGALYIPPKAGTNVFDATALTFEIDPGYQGLSLTNEVDDSVTYDVKRNTFSDTNEVTMALTESNGLLKGTFPSGHRTPFSYRGVVAGGQGYGFYIDAALQETGPIWLNNNAGSAIEGGTSSQTQTSGESTTTGGVVSISLSVP